MRPSLHGPGCYPEAAKAVGGIGPLIRFLGVSSDGSLRSPRPNAKKDESQPEKQGTMGHCARKGYKCSDVDQTGGRAQVLCLSAGFALLAVFWRNLLVACLFRQVACLFREWYNPLRFIQKD